MTKPAGSANPLHKKVVVQVSAGREWRSLRALLGEPVEEPTPVGALVKLGTLSGWTAELLYGGVGKIRSAASCQFAHSELNPDLMVMIGTCGSIDPRLIELELLLATKTIVYDIHSAVQNANTAQIRRHTSLLPDGWDTSDLPFPVSRATLATGDGDPDFSTLDEFRLEYGASAVDWESGAFAKVCRLNGVSCLILRGVSDCLPVEPEEADQGYRQNTPLVMERLWSVVSVILGRYISIDALPGPPRALPEP